MVVLFCGKGAIITVVYAFLEKVIGGSFYQQLLSVCHRESTLSPFIFVSRLSEQPQDSKTRHLPSQL